MMREWLTEAEGTEAMENKSTSRESESDAVAKGRLVKEEYLRHNSEDHRGSHQVESIGLGLAECRAYFQNKDCKSGKQASQLSQEVRSDLALEGTISD